MLPQWMIEKKRDGRALDESEIRDFIDAYANDRLPDYQMAAMAMAIFFQGMSFEEVTVLTDAMMRSGECINTSTIQYPTVDKHSTGGIGDKVSLILAPLVACCDLAVPMLSGRGLGITGGTLDKLDSIPGYRTDLSTSEFLQVVNSCGCCITGQTASLAPADKKLYALRDVTGTVPSIPLISASIMSKKLAEGATSLVLDVKWGRGAFMKTQEQARELAATMVEIGSRMDRNMAALITDMNQPLGRAVGNATEIVETVECLKGAGPTDLMTVTMELSAQLLVMAGKAPANDQARIILEQHLDSGAALAKFCEMVEQQGGDAAFVDDYSLLPVASHRHTISAEQGGYVADVDAEKIGKASLVLGAGRTRVTDGVDHAAGIIDLPKMGEPIEAGAPLMTLLTSDDATIPAALAELNQAVTILPEIVSAPALVAATILPEGASS